MSALDLIDHLRSARREAGISQAELGERIGLSASEVCRIETRQRRMPLRYLDPWARALRVAIHVKVSEGREPGVHVEPPTVVV